MRAQPRSTLSGLLVGATSVAATTGLIFALKAHMPVLSTGVLYLLGVLLVSSRWGMWLGLATAVASALAFNFFHIPPTGRFAIQDSGNWVGLGVYLVVAVVVSALSDQARARADEAEQRGGEAALAAELALLVLGPEPSALDRAAERMGAAFGVTGVRIVEGWQDGSVSERALPLVADGERIGTLVLDRLAPTAELEPLLPALGALLDARRRRAELEQQEIETQALRHSDGLKTALLRAVSHDLRSPLTAVRAAAGGIDSPTVDEAERRELADVIRSETDRLTALVSDLLDLSRLESGSAPPHPEACSLEEVVDAVIGARAERGTDVDVALPLDLPAVHADPAQLERVISNLIENAVRHGANGRAVAVSADAAGDRVHLRITDHGPGMDADVLSHVFEPFYRAEEASGGGSGLGLAIAKGFVEGNGGRLWAQSTKGEGSTFTVELPRAR